MKQNGIIGLGRGKLGTTVSSINGGLQVQREYRASIANPSTPGQVRQRARIKLMSQIGAAMNDVIAIPSRGIHTSRNLFAKRNLDFVIYDDGEASIDYLQIQLTNGSLGLPSVSLERSSANGVTMSLDSNATAVADRVVYNLFKKNTEAKLMLMASVVVEDAGTNGRFTTTVPFVSGDLIAYAYGIKFCNKKARALYLSYNVGSGADVAKLILSRKIKTSDFYVTYTMAGFLWENDNSPVIDTIDGLNFNSNGMGLIIRNDAHDMRGSNLQGHSWLLRSLIPGVVDVAGSINNAGTQVRFLVNDIASYQLICDGQVKTVVQINPDACQILRANNTQCYVGSNITISEDLSSFAIYGVGLEGDYYLVSRDDSNSMLGENALDDSTVVFTFTPNAHPLGFYYVKIDNKTILTVYFNY